MDPAATTSIAEELEGLQEAIDRLAALDPGSMADAELSEALLEMHRVRSRLEGVEARVTAAWDARGVWADDHARSGAAWLAHRTGVPVQSARARIRFARCLRHAPATEAALVAGEIGADQAKRLVRAATRAPEAFAGDEDKLLGHARALPFSHLHRVVSYWEQVADPDGTERDAKADDDGRRFHLSQSFEGAWFLDGMADPIGGTIFSNVLTAIERELFEADWRAAKEARGDEITPADLARTPQQRRLDALVEMARRAMTAPRNGRAPRPLFTVLVDYPTLSGRVCELADGTPLTPGQLVPWLSDADVERVVFDGASRVIDVGVRRRLFDGATRRAVEVRDRHCTFEGCEEPAQGCDVDHAVRYEAGGLTVQANGRLRCPPHNPGRRKPRRRRPSGPDPPA